MYSDGLGIYEIAEVLLSDSDFEGVDPLQVINYVEDTLEVLREEWEADMAGL
jgi:hypothetical protein